MSQSGTFNQKQTSNKSTIFSYKKSEFKFLTQNFLFPFFYYKKRYIKKQANMKYWKFCSVIILFPLDIMIPPTRFHNIFIRNQQKKYFYMRNDNLIVLCNIFHAWFKYIYIYIFQIKAKKIKIITGDSNFSFQYI